MTINSQPVFERRPSPSRAHRVPSARHFGTEANARLTSSTALVLLVLLAIEGVTVLRVGSLLTLHVFIGMLLVPPVLVKMASTFWRFTKYYTGSREYREKGPPPVVLRFGCMTIHVLGHVKETAQLSTKDWVRRTRVRVAGSRWRRLAITTSLASGLVLAFVTIPSVGPWLSAR